MKERGRQICEELYDDDIPFDEFTRKFMAKNLIRRYSDQDYRHLVKGFEEASYECFGEILLFMVTPPLFFLEEAFVDNHSML